MSWSLSFMQAQRRSYRALCAGLVIAAAASLLIPDSLAARDTPYWAALRADKVNSRVGPSQEFKINWVYKRKSLPVKVIRVMEGWRFIRDPDGDQGWVVESLLTDRRGGLIIGKGLVPMRAAPDDSARLKWNLEPGVVGWLGECKAGWCMFEVNGHSGYVREDRIWGAGEP